MKSRPTLQFLHFSSIEIVTFTQFLTDSAWRVFFVCVGPCIVSICKFNCALCFRACVKYLDEFEVHCGIFIHEKKMRN